LEEALGRLKVSRADAEDLLLLPELRGVLKRLDGARRPSFIYHALEYYPPRLLAVAWVAVGRSRIRQKLVQYQTTYRYVETILTGDDLKALGLKPDPLFGQLLGALQDARLDGKVATREDEEVLLRKLLKEEGIHLAPAVSSPQS
jgi:tRNA nucleotidyltransferase (CCA-adding enzyme)